MSSYHTPNRMAIINRQVITIMEKRAPVHCWWECQLVHIMENRMEVVPQKIKNRTAIGSDNPTSWHIFEGNEIRISERYLHPCAHCSIVHKSQDCRQPRCPSMNEWINEMWNVCVYVNMTEYYSVTERKEILPLVTTWRTLC